MIGTTKTTTKVKGGAPATVRAALYLRVSSEEQVHGHSLASQRDACEQYAAQRGWPVVAVFEDPGFSATSTNRPAFQRMLEAANNGEIQAIIVLRFDRFARSLEDWIVTRRQLQRQGVRLDSVTEPIEDNPMAPIMEALHGGLAEWYSRDLSAKVARGHRKRAEKGLVLGQAPFGYARAAGDDSHAPHVVVPEEAAAVLRAFERYATGTVSMVEIAAELNAAGFRTRHRKTPRLWSSQSVSAMLANRLYAGYVTHKGELLPGLHEPIVSEELWRQVERIRQSARGRRAGPKRGLYLLRGIARCAACGSALQGNHSRVGREHRYYRETARRRGIECDADQGSVRADWLEGEVDALVARFRMPDDVREQVLAMLATAETEDDPEAQRARLQERLRRLGELYADLQLGEGEYHARRRSIEAELDRLTVPAEQAVVAAETFDVLQAAWMKATAEEKRGLALTLFEAIYINMNTKSIADVVVQPAFRPWLSEDDAAGDESDV